MEQSTKEVAVKPKRNIRFIAKAVGVVGISALSFMAGRQTTHIKTETTPSPPPADTQVPVYDDPYESSPTHVIGFTPTDFDIVCAYRWNRWVPAVNGYKPLDVAYLVNAKDQAGGMLAGFVHNAPNIRVGGEIKDCLA